MRVVMVWSLAALSAAAFIAIGSQVVSAAGSPPKDEQEIRALQTRLAAAVSARDLDAVMKEYVPGSELFVFDSNLPRQHTGWEAYKKDWWDFLGSAVDVKASVEDLGITVEGEAAFSHDLLHLSWTKKSDGLRSEQLMSVTDAYRKIGGRWLIVMEHWSLPVEDGKAVLMAWPAK
jgi:ketosteroid isomerase-like protein